MSPMEHRSIRFLDDLYRGLFTAPGRVLLSATVALGLMQRETAVNGVLWLGFCTGALIVGLVVGFPFKPKLKLKRHLPPAPATGDLLSYRVTVQNVGKRVARSLIVEERNLPADLRPVGEPPMIDVLHPGETVSVTLTLNCLSRGAYELNRLQAATIFPAGLWKRAFKSREADTVLVYPKLTPVDRVDIPLGRSYQPGGVASASHVGDSTEFLGTREWRHGDRIRDLHWPSFARTGRLIVKEYQEEYFVRVALVVDAEVQNHREEVAFERGLGFVAGAARALAREEAIIDLVAVGSKVHRFQAGRAIAQFEGLLDVLACIEIEWESDMTAATEALLPEASKLSAVMFVFNQWDKERAALVQKIRDAGVTVRIVMLNPKPKAPGLLEHELLVLPA
jgi:uncharacterized protein (DUF58 family)